MELEKIESLIKPFIEKSGYVLYDVEVIGRTLRVSIEKPTGSVGVEDCAETSRLLGPILDVEDVITGPYDLEVSSPGLDRNLRRPEHFQKALGEKIHVTTKAPVGSWNDSSEYFEGRKNFKGMLKEFDGKILRMKDEVGREIVVPLEGVIKAYVDFEINKAPKKGKNLYG